MGNHRVAAATASTGAEDRMLRLLPLQQELRDRGLFRIPLDPLLEYTDPTLDDPWGCGRIDEEDIHALVGYLPQRHSSVDYDDELFSSYEYNIERIAYFLQEGTPDPLRDPEPITIDIGMAGYTPGYLIVDGNHRVAAAKLRGDSTIIVEIIGSLAKAEAVFFRNVHPDDYSEIAS